MKAGDVLVCHDAHTRNGGLTVGKEYTLIRVDVVGNTVKQCVIVDDDGDTQGYHHSRFTVK